MVPSDLFAIRGVSWVLLGHRVGGKVTIKHLIFLFLFPLVNNRFLGSILEENMCRDSKENF